MITENRVEPTKEQRKRWANEAASKRAEVRLSRRCPVIKAANRVLDGEKVFDSLHAVDLLLIELRGMPLATATVELLERIKGVGDGSNNSEN